MRVDHEAIRTISNRSRKSEGPSSLPDVMWKGLTPSHASLAFSLFDFLEDRERALQSQERPAVYRVNQALRKLPTIIDLSEKCRGLTKSFGTEKEMLKHQLLEYYDAIAENYKVNEYIPANSDVTLCDGYLFGLLGNVVHANIAQVWRDSRESSFRAESLTAWVHRNLQKGASYASP